MSLLFLFACTTEVTKETTEKIYVVDSADPADPDFDGFIDDDCGPTNGAINPQATDVVGDGIDQNCDGVDGTDVDLDGAASSASGGTDCNDADAAILPGATDDSEDGVDQDCNGLDGPILPIFEGDLTLGSDADEQWFCANYSGVLGALTVTAMDDASSLSCLRSVSADFNLTSAAESMEFPVLESVGGSLNLAVAATTVEFPALATVGGNLSSYDNLTTTTYSFPSLGRIEGALVIYSWQPTAIHVLSMPALTEVGFFEVFMDTQGGTFDFPLLATVDDSIIVGMTFTDVEEGAEAEVGTASFPSLASVGGTFQYYDNSGWGESPTNADFTSLATVGAFSATSLEDLEFPALASVTADVSVGGSGLVSLPLLSTPVTGIYAAGSGGISAPLVPSTGNLALYGYDDYIYGYDDDGNFWWDYVTIPGPAFVDLSGISTADAVAITLTELPDFSGFERLSSVAGYVDIEYNTSLEDVSELADLESVGGFYALYNSPVTDADFQAVVDAIPSVGETWIEGNGAE